MTLALIWTAQGHHHNHQAITGGDSVHPQHCFHTSCLLQNSAQSWYYLKHAGLKVLQLSGKQAALDAEVDLS
jgi:hypothetical protein